MQQNDRKTILMADDDPAHLLLAEAALAVPASCCRRPGRPGGRRALRRGAADCVILDVMMPRMSGIEPAGRSGSRRRRSGAILMLTGRNDLPAISDAYAAGASDFAQKASILACWSSACASCCATWSCSTAAVQPLQAAAGPAHRAGRTLELAPTDARCTSRRWWASCSASNRIT